MKAIKNIIYIATLSMALTACTEEKPFEPGSGSPLTVSATVPGEIWAVATRAGNEISAWTLHYIDYKGNKTIYVPTDVSVEGSAVSFTTGTDLVWAQIDHTKPMHLTCGTFDIMPSGERCYYILHTSVASATPDQPLALGTMTPTVAKLTVNFAFENNLNASADDFSITYNAKTAVDDYDPWTACDIWPAKDDASDRLLPLSGTAATNLYTVSGTVLLPQQTIGNTLTVVYDNGTADNTADDYPWTLDLNTVAVKNTDPVQYANDLKAGQHLTLNLKASVISLGKPSMEYEAFIKADQDDYAGDLDGDVQSQTNN